MSIYLQSFLDRCENRYADDRVGMGMAEWMTTNTKFNDRPFSFKKYPFQKQIADDMHPNMSVVKPSQVGLTEIQIRKVLAFIKRYKGVSAIYSLPNEKMYEKISTTRIRPIVDNDKVFNLEQVGNTGGKPARSKGLIQIDRSFLHVTGATEGDATATTADYVANDEVDLTDQKMIALFNSRLQGSDYRISHKFSTPTFTGYGIDQSYMTSDQHEYMVKCEHCNHHQVPLFNRKFVTLPGMPDSLKFEEIVPQMLDDGAIRIDDAYVHCEKCHKPLDLGNHEKRQWVAKYPNRTHSRGYRVRTFSTERLTPAYVITELFKYKAADNIRGWYNTVLGDAHEGGNERLSQGELESCFTHYMLGAPIVIGMPTWVGIDMGATCHIVVGQGYDESNVHIVEWVAVPIARLDDEVLRIRRSYNVCGGNSDRHPYTPDSDRVRDITNGLILPVEYRGQKEINIVKLPSGEYLYAQANRTILLDRAAGAIRRKSVTFSGYGSQKQTIIDHFRDMVREESPEQEAHWKKLSNNDHYFHAFGFMLSSMRINLDNIGTGLKPEVRDTIMVAGVNYAPSSTTNLYAPLGRQQKSNHGHIQQTLVF